MATLGLRSGSPHSLSMTTYPALDTPAKPGTVACAEGVGDLGSRGPTGPEVCLMACRMLNMKAKRLLNRAWQSGG